MEEDKDKETQATMQDTTEPSSSRSQVLGLRLDLSQSAQPPLNDATTPTLVTSSPHAAAATRASPRRPASKLRRTPSTQSLASTTSSAAPASIQLKKRTSMSSLRGLGTQTPPRSPVSASRRSSSNLLTTPMVKSPREPAKPVWTASSLAKEYLQKDIEIHNKLEIAPDVAVIFHDACYGHRFSRPKTSKANLSTIVERPERILAIAQGVSAAYILLGERHAGGQYAPHPTAAHGTIPFRIHKSSRNIEITSPAVTHVHGTKWMAELKEMCEAAETKLMQNGKELTRPKSADNSGRDKPRLHEGDLYLCAESLAALEGALGGVVDAVDTVFSPSGSRRVFACVRPPGHHCSDDYPSGFCWLNNVHVGIAHAAMEHGLTHAAIFDFDLHHGDGSQSIAWAQNARAATLPKNAAISKKTSIGYYSLHDINSYPCEWGDEDKVRNASLCIENAHGQNIWNVHLQPWKTDAEFWKLYDSRYVVLIEKMRSFLKTQAERFHSMGVNIRPKAAIFISAGFDASEWEGHGMQRHKVNVPTDFYARVTRDIVQLSEEQGLGVDGRVVSVLEGGYSDRALASGVLSHICGMTSMAQDTKEASQVSSIKPYDSNWWSPLRLEELERTEGSAAPQIKKTKTGSVPTYHSPTQSFVAKVASQATYQRSVANSISKQAPVERPRTPTPPPPEVDWAIASYELSQLIIPQDRQTRSCRAEDLNAKATEARKARQSTIGLPSASEDSLEYGMEKMNMREKRAKESSANTESRTSSRAASRAAANRRKTFGGVETPDKEIPRQPSRRLSATSTTLSLADDSQSKPVARVVTPAPPVAKTKTAPAAKPRAPRKTTTKPPVPRQTSAVNQSNGTSVPSESTVTAGESGMDDLVSGMKNIRIKLNPPSNEMRDNREAGKPSGDKDVTKPVRAQRKPAIKKAPVAKQMTKTAAAMPATAVPKPMIAANVEDGHESPIEALSRPQASIDPAQPPQSLGLAAAPIDSMMLKHTSYEPALAEYLAMENVSQPEGHQQPISFAQNTVMSAGSSASQSYSTPQTPVKRQLPTFTANSFIPFASAPVTPAYSRSQEPQDESTAAWAGEEFRSDFDNGFGPDHGYDAKHAGYSSIKEEDDMMDEGV